MKRYMKYFRITAKLYGAVLLMELVQRWATQGFSSQNPFLPRELVIVGLFSMVAAGALGFLCWLFSGKVGRKVFYVLSVVMAVIYGSQVVYYDIFGTYYSIYSMFNGAQVAEYQSIIWTTIWDEIIPLALLFAVGGLLLWGLKRENSADIDQDKKGDIGTANKDVKGVRGRKALSGLLICALLVTVGAGGGVAVAATTKEGDALALDRPYQYLHQFNEIKGSVASFGLLTAMGLDMWRLAFGFEPELTPVEKDPITYTASDEEDYNVMSGIDFGALAAADGTESGGDAVLAEMDRYFGSREGTKKNEKTGIFRGKNLIYITAESYADFAVSQKYTPTLYKLQQEGFQFTNFYNPIWGVSTLDGEYVNCLSQIPKSGVWSMSEAKDNDLAFALGNQFEKLGYETKAYHNHSIKFYHRNKSHANLGYDFDGQDGGFSFVETWPESDLEMIEKTVPDFLEERETLADGSKQPFHVYYLTVSGHMAYDFKQHDIAAKHEAEVADLELSDSCRAYVAANMELDLALESLLQQLEAAGELENTVIALAGDHYPYGLSAEEIGEFRGHPVDGTYELYHSNMLLWTPGMEPEVIEKTCSNLDILPTLSNLFGLEYDSRLLMGRDIFSDSEGLVVFEDKNWITDWGSRKDLLEKAAAGNEEAAAYILDMDRQVADMFIYSALILDRDYYAHIMGKEE